MWALPPFVALGTAAVIAFGLTRSRGLVPNMAMRRAAARMLAWTTAAQAVHFAEELGTGLDQALPAVFGLPAIPRGVFIVFNLAWIVVWLFGIRGIQSARPWALFAAWFLAVAGLINALVHPLMALITGAYFPGLISTPVVGLAAWLLLQRLLAATEPLQPV